jgi:transcriptional regulator with XRE-family HTH domain
MSPTPKQMGARIRRLRKAKRMSQQDVADKARLTRVFITRVEAGQQDPSLSTINAIARALDVSAADLMK